jgi:CheY-like chemotaxis protein
VTVLRILIAEDEPMLGTVLAELLEIIGHDVCGVYTTAASTVEAALRDRPDLMLVDAHLGKDSGPAAVAQILGQVHIPHIFMTGDMATLRMLKALAITLEKPFQEPDLVKAIAQAMGQPNLQP